MFWDFRGTFLMVENVLPPRLKLTWIETNNVKLGAADSNNSCYQLLPHPLTYISRNRPFHTSEPERRPPLVGVGDPLLDVLALHHPRGNVLLPADQEQTQRDKS